MIARFLSMLRQRLRRHELYCQPTYWNAKASEYQGSSVSMWPNQHLNELYHQEAIETLNPLLPDCAGKRVLDVGCGTGRYSQWLAGRGASVTALDFAESVVAIARQQSGDLPITYITASMFEVPLETTFDGIFTGGSVTVACSSPLHFKRLLAEFRRLTHAGSWVLMVEPFHSGIFHRVLDLSPREVIRQMKSEGFEVASVKHLHFLPARIALAFIPWPRWFTRLHYRWGHALMNLTHDGWCGDYRAILAYRRG